MRELDIVVCPTSTKNKYRSSQRIKTNTSLEIFENNSHSI